MKLIGYHGTSQGQAIDILSKGYHLSHDDDEWLGDGIYFYFKYKDAYNWKTDAVLRSTIKIKRSEYLDIDTKIGESIFREMVNIIYAQYGSKIDPYSTGDDLVQKNQCALMRMIWDTYPKIKVISAAFPYEKTTFKTLIDKRLKRREFCVRSNEYIVSTYLYVRRLRVI